MPCWSKLAKCGGGQGEEDSVTWKYQFGSLGVRLVRNPNGTPRTIKMEKVRCKISNE